MIKPLEAHPHVDEYGNCYGIDYPTKYEMYLKINEIIEYLNSKEND